MAGKTKDFYALLSKVLHDYLANKWHQSSSRIKCQEAILSRLKTEPRLDEAHLAQIKTILDTKLIWFVSPGCYALRLRIRCRQISPKAQDLIAHLEKI